MGLTTCFLTQTVGRPLSGLRFGELRFPHGTFADRGRAQMVDGGEDGPEASRFVLAHSEDLERLANSHPDLGCPSFILALKR